MKLLVIVCVAFVALLSTSAAEAHLVAKPKSKSLTDIYHSQVANYNHVRYVCNHGGGKHKRWSCKAMKWLGREVHESYVALYPSVVVVRTLQSTGGGYTGISSIGYARASCESGGDPHNTHNSKYRGKWQFDQSTWDAFAPKGYVGVDPAYAPESVQDQTALSVNYDAWPNC